MQLIYRISVSLFIVAVLLQIASPLVAEPLQLYLNVFFFILVAAASLAMLFYFLLTRKGKGRPI